MICDKTIPQTKENEILMYFEPIFLALLRKSKYL